MTNTSNSRQLQGRRIVVTGAGSGIGLATAKLFLEQGAQVAFFDRNKAAAEAALDGGNGIVCEVDITDQKSVATAVEQTAKAFGGIDGVINAAGIMSIGPTRDLDLDTWNRIINTNLTGSFMVVKSCLPYLEKEENATIINIASAAGLLPNAPGLVAYAASKGGVISLTRALASDLAPKIRVNCVCPGMVDTPMAVGNGGNVQNYALKRLAKPIEIAQSLLFLTSDASSYTTGSIIAVDGGRSFH